MNYSLCQYKTVVPWPSGDIEGQCSLAEGHGGHHELMPVEQGRGEGVGPSSFRAGDRPGAVTLQKVKEIG